MESPALYLGATLRQIEQAHAEAPLMQRAGLAAADWACELANDRKRGHKACNCAKGRCYITITSKRRSSVQTASNGTRKSAGTRKGRNSTQNKRKGRVVNVACTGQGRCAVPSKLTTARKGRGTVDRIGSR
jgi:hypothetical protein